MTTEKIYLYRGDNGSILSPVHLEGVACQVRLRIKSDSGKVLTNGSCRTESATILEADLDKWSEIDA